MHEEVLRSTKQLIARRTKTDKVDIVLLDGELLIEEDHTPDELVEVTWV